MKDTAQTKKQLVVDLETLRQQQAVGQATERLREEALAITRNTVELLGGTIEVESQVGRGTTFYPADAYKADAEAAIR